MLTLALHVRYFFHGRAVFRICFLYKALQERYDHSALSFIDTLSRKQTVHLSQARNTLMCEKDTATLSKDFETCWKLNNSGSQCKIPLYMFILVNVHICINEH